jgi:hypothetical protein
MTEWALVKLLGGVRASIFALLATLALAACGVQSWRLDHAQASATRAAASADKAALASEHAARAEEQTRARYMSGVDAAYERGKADAKATGDSVAAGLRTGNLRLSRLWRGCEARAASVPGATASAGEPDGAADDRAGSAGRIVGAARKGDQQTRCLQAVVLIDRGLPTGDLSKDCPKETP